MNSREAEVRNVVMAALGRIAPDADLSTLHPTVNIREALEIDSYDFLQFLIAINRELGVDIPEADYGRLQKLGDLLAYLEARVGDDKASQ